MKRYVISSIDHMVRIINQYPQLMGLSSLAGIREVGQKASSAVKKSGCGCSAGPIYATYKNIFEQALNVMGNGTDHLIVKNILKVDQLCYNTRDNKGKNTLKCI